MIKAMVVDDEINTRESLREFVPWEDMGVDVVETAKNGLAALELIKLMEPDILLTDVRMPKMDGIELATKIRGLYPDCKIIFLSGYADKEYLKQAIHLNAVSYIEKPINMEEIKTVILKAISQCKEDDLKRTEALQLKRSMIESMPLVRQEIALELIKEHTDIAALTSKFSDTLFHLPTEAIYSTAYIRMNWSSSLDNPARDSVKQTLLKLFLEPDRLGFPSCLAGFDASDNIVLIVAESHPYIIPSIEIAYEQLLNTLIEMSEDYYDVSIGIGVRIDHLSQISKSYQTAVQASLGQFYLGTNRILNPETSGGYHFVVDREVYDRFRNNLNADKIDETLQMIRKMTDDIRMSRDNDLLHVKHIYLQFIITLLDVVKDRGIDHLHLHSGKDMHNIRRMIEGFHTLTELADFVLDQIETIFGDIEEKDSVSRKMYRITQYIKENYTDPALSIHAIAVYSNFSETYLCAFFKKSTGKTLNAYITEIRMEKAKELLKDSRFKLYEVANQLGYKDANYFSTLFKRYTGCTPSKFMEKYYL